MLSEKDFRTLLFSSFEETQNYSEVADFYRERETAFEKLLFIAVLTGSGIVLLFLAKVFFDKNTLVEFKKALVLVSWVFAGSLTSAFIGGIMYVLSTAHSQNHQRIAGNGQARIVAARKFLKNAANVNIDDKMFIDWCCKLASGKADILEAKAERITAHRYESFAKRFLYSSIIMFGIGLFLSLIFFTFKTFV